jgi:hypothetical protein
LPADPRLTTSALLDNERPRRPKVQHSPLRYNFAPSGIPSAAGQPAMAGAPVAAHGTSRRVTNPVPQAQA